MTKGFKISLLSISILISSAVSLYLFFNNLIDYLIITLAVTLILIFSLIIFVKNNKSPEDRFKSQLKNILKTYDGILISSSNIPKLEGKNIILVDSIQDIIDAQTEIRKPIYYKKTISSCSFILLDRDEACIYTLKESKDIVAPIDEVLDTIRKNEEKRLEEGIDESILKEIEKTTIVKLKDKAYRISPIRKKKEENIEIL